MQHVRAAASCADATAVQSELKSLSVFCVESAQGGLEILRGKLIKLIDRTYRLQKLKEVGIESIPEEWNLDSTAATKIPLRQNVMKLLNKLNSSGLFLVPVGELESWMPVLMKDISREDKSKWAMNAAGKIEELGERDNDVWSFLRSVAQFLSDHFGLEPVGQVAAGSTEPLKTS
jgi:hypothetical protein